MKVQKIPVDGGFTCPNRDGSKGVGGCSFCNPNAFAPNYFSADQSASDIAPGIKEQLEAGKRFFASKHRGEVEYLAYFQSFSGTYASIDTLRVRYLEALAVDGVKGLVIGTRPDCVNADILNLLVEISQTHSVQVEYGVESCYDKTLQRVGRGHDFACVKDAILRTAALGISVGVHLILGLPGETREEMLQEADLLSALPVRNLKLHQLQIMQGTRMAEEWQQHPADFQLFSVDEYIEFVVSFMLRLRSDIIVERVAAGAPSRMLLAPRWGIKPAMIQQMIEKAYAERIRHTEH